MSMFGGGKSPFGGGAPANNEKIEAAAMEIDMVSDLFSRIVRSCHAKCIDDKYYADGQLNKGEGVCVDRCVAKYIAANEVVGKQMQKQNEDQAAQQQAQQGGGSSFGGLFGR